MSDCIWQIVIYRDNKPRDGRHGTESDMRRSYHTWKEMLVTGESIAIRNDRVEIERFDCE